MKLTCEGCECEIEFPVLPPGSRVLLALCDSCYEACQELVHGGKTAWLLPEKLAPCVHRLDLETMAISVVTAGQGEPVISMKVECADCHQVGTFGYLITNDEITWGDRDDAVAGIVESAELFWSKAENIFKRLDPTMVRCYCRFGACGCQPCMCVHCWNIARIRNECPTIEIDNLTPVDSCGCQAGFADISRLPN